MLHALKWGECYMKISDSTPEMVEMVASDFHLYETICYITLKECAR